MVCIYNINAPFYSTTSLIYFLTVPRENPSPAKTMVPAGEKLRTLLRSFLYLRQFIIARQVFQCKEKTSWFYVIDTLN